MRWSEGLYLLLLSCQNFRIFFVLSAPVRFKKTEMMRWLNLYALTVKEFIILYFDFSFQPSVSCFDECLDSCTNSFLFTSISLSISLSCNLSSNIDTSLTHSTLSLSLNIYLCTSDLQCLSLSLPLTLSLHLCFSASLSLFLSLPLCFSVSLSLSLPLPIPHKDWPDSRVYFSRCSLP